MDKHFYALQLHGTILASCVFWLQSAWEHELRKRRSNSTRDIAQGVQPSLLSLLPRKTSNETKMEQPNRHDWLQTMMEVSELKVLQAWLGIANIETWTGFEFPWEPGDRERQRQRDFVGNGNKETCIMPMSRPRTQFLRKRSVLNEGKPSN